MSLYPTYKTKMQSTLTDKDLAEDKIICTIKQDFYSHPNYYSIYKNSTPSTTYDVVIQNSKKKNAIVRSKELISYPYDTPQFTIGDNIHWTYGGDATVWLLVTNDRQYTYSIGGQIIQCNHVLQWVDDSGNDKSENCVILDIKMNFIDLDESKIMNLPDTERNIYIQQNTDTDTLIRNKRLVFNDTAWEIINIDKIGDTGSGLLTITVQEAGVNANSDDVDNDKPGSQVPPTVTPGERW